MELEEFRYIIFDPPLNFDLYTRTIISESNHVLPLVEPDSFRIDTIFNFQDELKKIKNEYNKEIFYNIILINKYNKSNEFHKRCKKEIETSPFKPIFIVPKTDSIPYACAMNCLLNEYKPENPAINVYDDLAKYFRDTYKAE